MMHREIRLNNLVLSSLSPTHIISIDRVLLDCNLSNIKYNTAKNYEKYKNNYCATMPFRCNIKVLIFITPKEREEYNKIEKNI